MGTIKDGADARAAAVERKLAQHRKAFASREEVERFVANAQAQQWRLSIEPLRKRVAELEAEVRRLGGTLAVAGCVAAGGCVGGEPAAPCEAEVRATFDGQSVVLPDTVLTLASC